MKPTYVPRRGDVVYLDLEPHRGREHGGTRTVLVLSPDAYNRKVGLAVVCPITNQVKGYAFEVEIADNPQVSGVALADQVRAVDWRKRRANFVCYLGDEIVQEVAEKFSTLIALEE